MQPIDRQNSSTKLHFDSMPMPMMVVIYHHWFHLKYYDERYQLFRWKKQKIVFFFEKKKKYHVDSQATHYVLQIINININIIINHNQKYQRLHRRVQQRVHAATSPHTTAHPSSSHIHQWWTWFDSMWWTTFQTWVTSETSCVFVTSIPPFRSSIWLCIFKSNC